MKLYASKLLGQKTYQIKVKDPLAGGPGRISQLAEIEEEAVGFVDEILMDLDLPSAPTITLGATKGFENVQTDLKKVIGTVTVYASFHSLSGQKLRLEFPVPVVRGSFQRPSIVIINNKPHIFSKALIDNLVATTVRYRPHIESPFGSSPRETIFHEEVIEKPMFSSPDSHNDTYALVMEKY